MKPKMELTKEQKDDMVGKIQLYFEKERGEPVGNLAAMMLLEFIIKEIAPHFYNIGVEDSHAFMSMKLDDIFEIQKWLIRGDYVEMAIDGRYRKNIHAGLEVEIVLKKDQRTGITTSGVVKDLLTNSSYHPHGIKVRLADGQVGRVHTK